MAQPPVSRDTSASHGAALREAKIALRRQVLARRDAMDPDAFVAAASAIASRVVALPQFIAARNVLLTLAFRSEWSTVPVVRAALDAGKTVVAPRVNGETRMLELHALADPTRGIVANAQGIPEPSPETPRVPLEAIDFVLVPGVAFDLTGRRLGYGGGYYDRLLPLLPRTPPRIAGIFEIQLVDDVPCAPHDLTVDMLVTESRIVVFPR